MNDEIKEILDNVKKCCDITKDQSFTLYQRQDILVLLDYITNLQQKVEQYENPDDLTLFYMWLDEKAKDKMKKLQQENQDLKRMCELYGQSLYNADLTKYKSRNNKAIEYIEKHSNSLSVLDTISNAELLKILQGDSDD